MPKGISIHIGVNYVDEKHYGSKLSLPFCASDALAMQSIAMQNGFEHYVFLNENATTHNFLYMLSEAASELQKDDMLFISFSGHGSFFQDINGDEEDGYDEAILFYNRIMVDDELHLEWTKFQPGVRILFISDSCHSGTITKRPRISLLKRWYNDKTLVNGNPLDEVYRKNKWHYDALFKNITPTPKTSVECSVLLLSACQEDEVAEAGNESLNKLSPFTEVLMTCWAEGRFYGNYNDYHNLVCYEMKQRKIEHIPNYYFIGSKNLYFEQEVPFTI